MLSWSEDNSKALVRFFGAAHQRYISYLYVIKRLHARYHILPITRIYRITFYHLTHFYKLEIIYMNSARKGA